MAKKSQGPLDIMVIKIREMLSRLNLHTGLLIALLIILLIFLILFIAYWIYVSKWYGVTDVACSDCKTCTTDFKFPDGTCGSRAVQNGTSCAGEDVCYNSSAMPVCLCGLCIGSDSRFCKGYCDVDGSECPDLPISPRLTFEPDVECIAHSCVYTIVGGITADCESWLGENRTLPIVTQECLTTRFTDAGYDFPPGICFLRYKCAPFDFIESVSLSHGHNNNHNKNHKVTNSKHQSIKSTNKNGTIHKSDINDLTSALVYLQINNLKFPDLPTKDTQIISLTNMFANIIDSKINAYNTQTLSRISKSGGNNNKNKNNKDSETTPDETDEDDDDEDQQQQQQNDEKKLSDYVNKHKQKN